MLAVSLRLLLLLLLLLLMPLLSALLLDPPWLQLLEPFGSATSSKQLQHCLRRFHYWRFFLVAMPCALRLFV